MASAMRAARSQLDIATHNLANASTDGFRRAFGTVSITGRGLAGRFPGQRLQSLAPLKPHWRWWSICAFI